MKLNAHLLLMQRYRTHGALPSHSPKYVPPWALLWLMQLVAGLSLQRPGSVHVGFVLGKVAVRQVSL
jgi:hypothetical protein